MFAFVVVDSALLEADGRPLRGDAGGDRDGIGDPVAAEDRAGLGLRNPAAGVGISWLMTPARTPMAMLACAASATLAIALLQAVSSYLTAYNTVSIGQSIAHDLRRSVYAHLQRLSMSYYDRQQTGPLISTITDDINAIQDFISTSVLDIVVDGLTIVGMLVVMFWLSWRFALIALAAIPVLVFFVSRLRAAVKAATRTCTLSRVSW